MADDQSLAADPSTRGGLRDRNKEELRNRITDEVIALMVEGGAHLNHDVIAERAGVGRRTVYRYFPDRDSLLEAAWVRVRELAGPQVVMPDDMDHLLTTLEPIYTGFDKIAPIATVVRSTPQGRALRLAQNKARVETYTAVAAEIVSALPEGDRRLATAILQMLHTTPWLEMRDHWGLDGRQIARATGWVIRTLLADLKARGGLPLDQDLPAAAAG